MESAASQVKRLGRGSLNLACDVSDRSSLEALLAATLKEFGEIDILVDCAGITKRTPTLDVSDSEWNQILQTNLNGTLRACQVFGRSMLERSHHQYSVTLSFCGPLRGRRLCRQQSRCCCSYQVFGE